jgi:hypothetical protein
MSGTGNYHDYLQFIVGIDFQACSHILYAKSFTIGEVWSICQGIAIREGVLRKVRHDNPFG